MTFFQISKIARQVIDNPNPNIPCHFCTKLITSNHHQYIPIGSDVDEDGKPKWLSIHPDCFGSYIRGIKASKARLEKQHQSDRFDIRNPNSLYYQDEIQDPNTSFEEWTDLPGKCYNSHFQRFKDPWEIITPKEERNTSPGTAALFIHGREIGIEFNDIEDEFPIQSQEEKLRKTMVVGLAALACLLKIRTYYLQ